MRYLALLAISTCLAGCRSDVKPVIGVVPKGANHIFWQTVHAGALKAAKELNVDIEWNAPTLEIDSSRQIAIVESMVNRRLAGIALAPVDRKALVGVVERAAAAGIPVAIFDSDIDTEKRLTYVATDNREGGRMAARKMGELLLGEGEVAIISFMPGSAATMEREEGFREEIKKTFSEDSGLCRRRMGWRIGRRLVQRPRISWPRIRICEGCSRITNRVRRERCWRSRLAGDAKVRMMAFDSNDQLVADLQDRYIDALVIQKPLQMGYESVKALGRKLQGQPVESRVDLPAVLVTRADLEKPDVIELLHPDLRTWLSRR